MSRTFYFGNVTKRKNSTLQGTITNAFDVLFKNPTSLDNPTLTLNYSGDFDYNVAKYVTSDTSPKTYYYFVRDKVARNNDLWEVSLELDVLATYKTEILATTAYVLYDSVSNTEIPDNRLPMKTTATVKSVSEAFPFAVDSGCYILSVTGNDNSTGIYKVDSSELAALIDDLSHIEDNIFDFQNLTPPTAPTAPPVGSSLEDYVNFVGECMKFVGDYISYMIQCAVKPITQFFGSGNIPENIRQCIYLPFNRGTTTPGPAHLCLGTFETKQQLNKLNTKTVVENTTINIPWPTGLGIGDYRRRSPYTELYLYLPYIGMTRLSSENLANVSTLNIQYVLGMLDGTLVCTVKGGGEVIGQYSGNVAAAAPIGFSNINIPKAAQSLIGGTVSALQGNIAGVGLAGINFGETITPNYTCIGGMDGVAATASDQSITCYSVFHDTIVAPNTDIATIGAPSMRPKQLSGLSGYCQCMDAHVALDADSPIMDKVDSFLNSGFFIE